ncbi:hypothetical protein D3C72_2082830 [compost metagenome]
MLLQQARTYMLKNLLETPFGNVKSWLPLRKNIIVLYRWGNGNVVNSISEMQWHLYMVENWVKSVWSKLGLIKVG